MVIDWASVGTKLDVHASGPSWCFNTPGNSFVEPLASIEGIFGELIYPFDFPVLPGKITSHVVFTTGSPSAKTAKDIKLTNILFIHAKNFVQI